MLSLRTVRVAVQRWGFAALALGALLLAAPAPSQAAQIPTAAARLAGTPATGLGQGNPLLQNVYYYRRAYYRPVYRRHYYRPVYHRPYHRPYYRNYYRPRVVCRVRYGYYGPRRVCYRRY